MGYQQRGGDGEGARLDLREQIQEEVYFQFCCSVREICQGPARHNTLSEQSAASRPVAVGVQLVLAGSRAEL
ncbi:hypothetical protein F7725_015188 [Dissostichus mawsoni]|uniref:Uncharacterized protein n=1 Tax=Dissostichus mawsoni TaxID=36200 RepID=A0A7J5YI92_DISMA|nr:hypothetical protein F7725_015188 [Dissostichus mawsoni]